MTIKDEFLQLAQSRGARQIRVTVQDDQSIFGMRGVQLFPDRGDDVSDELYDYACREMRGEIEHTVIAQSHPNIEL